MDVEDARSFDFDERWVTWSRWLFVLGLAGVAYLAYSGQYLGAIAAAGLAVSLHKMGTYLRVIELLQEELS